MPSANIALKRGVVSQRDAIVVARRKEGERERKPRESAAERILERIFECSARDTGISAFTTVKVYFTLLCAHALFRFPSRGTAVAVLSYFVARSRAPVGRPAGCSRARTANRRHLSSLEPDLEPGFFVKRNDEAVSRVILTLSDNEDFLRGVREAAPSAIGTPKRDSRFSRRIDHSWETGFRVHENLCQLATGSTCC